ncbi:hypothetical protein [Pleurocapsa sp. FMAR1]|nr:hypothetical protein [Pleurocapsa sp. FMAR1]
MFLICLLLIGLIASATVTDTELSTVELAEFIPVHVRLDKADSLRKFG